MEPAAQSRGVASAITLERSSTAPSRPIFRSSSRPGSSSSSISRPPRRSALPCRRRSSPAPTRSLSEASRLRRLGDIEGQNLTVERYSGEGRPERHANLAREVVDRNPDVIVASTDAIAQAARAANGAVPIVWIGGDPIQAGLATSLARPGGNVTGVTVDTGVEIWGKRLQILKEVIPPASKVAFLAMRGQWEGPYGQQLREASERLKISLIGMPLQESTPSEYQRRSATH